MVLCQVQLSWTFSVRVWKKILLLRFEKNIKSLRIREKIIKLLEVTLDFKLCLSCVFFFEAPNNL